MLSSIFLKESGKAQGNPYHPEEKGLNIMDLLDSI
jgi:hypothetical protein